MLSSLWCTAVSRDPGATKPAIVFVPWVIAGEIMTGFGLLLAATAGRLAETIRMLAGAGSVGLSSSAAGGAAGVRLVADRRP